MRRPSDFTYGDAMGNQLLGDKVWSDIAPHLKRATTVNAAIGYVSSTAESVFTPPSGSRLIVDGSDPALRGGLTSPAVLRRWIARDITVRSVPGLHAKSMVITYADGIRRLVVGSANASENSANELRELAVIVDDEALTDSVENLFNGWWAMGKEVDDTWLDRADGLYQAPRDNDRPRRAEADFIDWSQPLWLGPWSPTNVDLTPEQAVAVQEIRSQFPEFEVIWWLLEHGDEARVLEGHTVVLFGVRPDGSQHGSFNVFGPAHVSQVLPGVDGAAPLAILARPMGRPNIRFTELRRVAAPRDGEVITDKPIAEPHLKDAVFSLWP